MDTDPLQARIDEIERALYAPQHYAPTVVSPVRAEDVIAQQEGIKALAEELNRLRAEQIHRATQKFGRLAPIGGARLTTGHLPRPEAPAPRERDWMSTADESGYDPIRRFLEEDLGRSCED